MGLVAFYDEEEAEERTYRHTVRKQPSASQDQNPHKKNNVTCQALTLDFKSLDCEKTHLLLFDLYPGWYSVVVALGN